MKRDAAMWRRTVGTGLSAVLSTAHRPMFPAAAAAACGVVLWRLLTDSPAPQASPLGTLWHGHELVFGMGGAALAGYTLTAAPSWSRRPPVHGAGIAMLLALWLLARVAAAGWVGVPAVLAAAFPAGLALLLAGEALAGRSPKGAAQAGLALALTFADLAVLTGRATLGPAILVFAVVIAAVGGRMVRAFTENRRALDGTGAPLPRDRALGLAAPAAIGAAMVLELAGRDTAAGGALLLAAIMETRRLWRWQVPQVRRDALVAMLHLGYLWLPVGLWLTGLARLGVGPADTDAQHALTAGAMACLIQAVAARATAHRGRSALRARHVDSVAFASLWGAALLRLTLPGSVVPAGILWIAGWGLVLASHLGALRRPPPRPVFSGPRA